MSSYWKICKISTIFTGRSLRSTIWEYIQRMLDQGLNVITLTLYMATSVPHQPVSRPSPTGTCSHPRGSTGEWEMHNPSKGYWTLALNSRTPGDPKHGPAECPPHSRGEVREEGNADVLWWVQRDRGPIRCFFSSPRLLVETHMLSNWPNPHTGFLSNVTKAIMEKRAMKQSLELLPLSSVRK